ncbi:phosphotransacetylase family protein [Cyanobacterium sp. Dongsha4]|uniref:phosphotransacetylase family protein n=1 Tax=Cyanobacterium sp. DS4 TaxID=2878255 RepID=UPI002E8015D9|nr:phosphotransacetylase family protein [Cyanobacterium sp. Dongsha4]WVL02347.1 phosphotransacetylase family protein [Cyanobacterium sp. Dongsha4]
MVSSQSKHLLIASSEPYTGKTATILGIAHQLQKKGVKLGYGKPIGTCFNPDDGMQDEQDLQFISEILGLPPERVKAPLLFLDEKTITDYLKTSNDYQDTLQEYCDSIAGDLILLEGAGNLTQGKLFNLSVPEIVEKISAEVLLVVKYDGLLIVDQILHAKEVLDDRLLGVLINSIPNDALDHIESDLKPFFQSRGIDILGMLPTDRLLQSVSVRELVSQLNARVLCRENRLDLMVESLTVGAMNVNSALEYFRKGQNMAVVTGSDRTDLQLAALESSTNCLILTGHTPPQQLILARAEDLEIPILMVDCDTLTTVEIIDRAFGKVRLHETIKVECMQNLIEEHFDVDLLLKKLG